MTTKEIIALAQAGFTVQEIATLNRLDINPQSMETGTTPMSHTPAPVNPVFPPQAVPAPSPSPSPAPATATDQAQVPDQTLNPVFQALLDRFNRTEIANSSQPPIQTADDVLAQIINPPKADK